MAIKIFTVYDREMTSEEAKARCKALLSEKLPGRVLSVRASQGLKGSNRYQFHIEVDVSWL